MTTVFLVRHGESEWNRQKRITGQLDPALSPKGAAQAKALARVLRGEPLTAIYTSPLTRARATAEPTAAVHGLIPHLREALKEMALGVLQGCFRDERDPAARRLWSQRASAKLDFRVPGGETFPELEQRVLPCLEEILAQERGRTFLIVGHRNVNRVILGALMRWSSETALAARPKSTDLYRISVGQAPRLTTLPFADVLVEQP